jgi:hypothetical protein
MKTRVSLSLDEDLLHRIDAAAGAINATRSFTVATLARRALEALGSEGGGGEVVSGPFPPPGAAIIEIDPASIPHVAVAGTLAEAAALARARGLRWAAGGGQPHEVAALMPPLEAAAAVCANVAIASALATAPNWHRCSPQLARYGFTK